jgi:hypothetical protein
MLVVVEVVSETDRSWGAEEPMKVAGVEELEEQEQRTAVVGVLVGSEQ